MASSSVMMLMLLGLGAFAPTTSMRMIVRRDSELAAANPIRKVVNMLTAMQKKVKAEGEKEKQLFDKYMCYCKSSGGELAASIAAATDKAPALASDIESSVQEEVQTKADLKKAQTDREAAKATMAEATAIREKESAAFAKEKAELDSDIAAVDGAVDALNKGMAGAFVQTEGAQTLKRVITMKSDITDMDRSDVLSFLSGTQGEGYAPKSGEIMGIIRQIGEDMKKNLAESTATEDSAVAVFAELMSAKKKEVEALTSSVEAKTKRIGELAVSIVMMKNDLSDTQEALIEDQKFQAALEHGCATKGGEFAEAQKTRGEELVALSETIKILNDDDALELFKKTLPGSSSFVQVSAGKEALRMRALATIHAARQVHSQNAVQLDFLMLALRGKAAGFEKVIKMIDDMVALLNTEQVDDDNKKEYCNNQLDNTEDKKKYLMRKGSDTEAAIEKAQEELASLADEIKALSAGITALDKSVAEATETRKAEHAEYTEVMASNGAAKELLGFAKNRLNKFYNPKLYTPPAKTELSREDKIVENMSFLQVRRAPDAAPETGSYSKKSEESGGVIAMIDLLIKDLDKEMTESETEEKDAQSSYEEMMNDSAEKRASDTKSLSQKTGAKAEFESELESHKEVKADTLAELMATQQYISTLHGDCDFLLQTFQARKEAREGELDSLKKAKAVLSGADFS